jgi:hypothetical protein
VYFLRYNCYIELDWIDGIHAQKEAEQRMLLNDDGDDNDDVADMQLSYCERLRLNLDVPLSETSLKRPVQKHNTDKHTPHLQQESARENAGVEHSTHPAKKQRRT